ncbi:MAG TPA: hypothetical protein DCL61_04735 [Cyanobacteria bacterium UBA12227]|nr:hypothetical protein [Cyanobacteria bacterium UBA12227]
MDYFLENAAYFLNNYVQVTRGYSPYLKDEDPDLQKAANNPKVLRNCWEHEVERATNPNKYPQYYVVGIDDEF